ncbi:MAG TPA: ester cyclase [Chloroflexi bacterium]|jgi:steroid delta-isomerase-like uncharacterized protein|nr:ester cyclase [Chloroflexota bacterium]
MSSEENKAAEERLVAEVWNRHNPQAVDEFVAPDVVMNNSVLALGNGREGYKRALVMVFAAFPDVQLTIEDLIAEGDLVAERWTMRGTQQGEFMGMPATNNQLTLTGIDIYRYAGGKRVEAWGHADVAGMMKQLRGA